MKIQSLSLYPREFLLKNGKKRSIILIKITDESGDQGWGEIAPLPSFSQETLEECNIQLYNKHDEIIRKEWFADTCLKELSNLELFPSVSFGLESALLSILLPISNCKIHVSALLMGTYQEIIEQADQRRIEGYTSAKLKVSNLDFKEARDLIYSLKENFNLRIDVNRAWTTTDSLDFFSQFPLNTFEYVEEPFQNPHDLGLFKHPLAVDESFPNELSLSQLEFFPTLKALIYKPTIQGGMANCLQLHEWTIRKKISLVLSSSFESNLGLSYIAQMAHRLSCSAPIGIGTYHYLTKNMNEVPLKFAGPYLHVEEKFKSFL